MQQIMADKLQYSKACALTDDNRAATRMFSFSYVRWYTAERNAVTAGDETAISLFTYTPERSTMEWECPSSPRTLSASKVLGIVFWDSLDVLPVDFLEHRCSVNTK
jgi:hypothetical protein